jgi:hypothetical protein
MRFRYKMMERKEAPKGHSFVVQASVDLDAAEIELHNAYDVAGCLVIGKAFTEVRGVDTLGDVKLDQFIGRSAEFQFPTIQMANEFVGRLSDGLSKLKESFATTQSAIRALDKEVELEF